MKPKNIFLVRHGESQGNVDKTVYEHTPDWKVELTEKGRLQAKEAGEILAKNILQTSTAGTAFYISPWLRARQTADEIKLVLGQHRVPITQSYEDPRLREQGWGNYQNADRLRKIAEERDRYGNFFYSIEDGESGADVYDRMSIFLDTLYRDFCDRDYPENVVIVSHGISIKVFLMRWFHWTVEEFELLRNPKNCQICRMEYNMFSDKYTLVTSMNKRTV